MDQTIAKLIESRPALPDANDIPGVQAVQAKVAALRARLDRLDREVREVLAAAPTAKATAAERLYAGLDADDAPDPGADQRVAELRKARRICSDAIKLGEDELKRLIRTAAPALLEPLKAWHRSLVVEAARRLVEAQVLAGCESAMLREVEAAGLPAGGIGELAQVPDVEWFVSRLVADGVLTGNEDWLPDGHKPTPAPAPSLVAGAINAVRRAVGGGKAPAKQAGEGSTGGFELWQ